MHSVVISGTGLWVAPNVVSNEELVAAFNAYAQRFNAENAAAIAAGTLAAIPESSAEFVEKASGIKQRYVVDKDGVLDPARMRPKFDPRPDDALSLQAEIGVEAAKQALANASRMAADIDMVICAASNMQRPYPAMAVEIQGALGAGGYAFDMNVACSSATFGLEQAINAVKTGAARAALVVNPEICSAHLAWKDRDCHFIFGDVCTAIVVERADTATSADRWEVLGTKLAFQPRRRGDAQFIFAPSQAQTARQLRPQLRFHYAGDLPTYSTSDAYEPHASANQDLDGLIFPDMPWVFGVGARTAQVRDALRSAWGEGAEERGKLFAFGFDAYQLSLALPAGRSADIDGLTGTLRLESDRRIRRQLVWAQIANGQARLLGDDPAAAASR